MSTRDTKFQCFANSLWEELCRNFGSWYEFDNDNTHNESRDIIARRAYDLLEHAIGEIDTRDLDSLDMHEFIARIPDMTELPKETP